MSLVRPGSHCPKCGTPIPWYRNLPVATWIFQGGRCAVCKCRIPVRYVLVEAFCALLAGAWCLLALRGQWPTTADAAGWIVLALCGVPIALIDWDTYEIPDGLVVLAGVGAFAARQILSDDPLYALPILLRDALLSCGLLYALSFVSRVGLGWLGKFALGLLRGTRPDRRRLRKPLPSLLLRWARLGSDVEALGLGDVSLALASGAALGFPSVLLGLPLAAILGVAGHLLLPRAAMASKARVVGLDPHALPFGPFLVVGFLVASLVLASRSWGMP